MQAPIGENTDCWQARVTSAFRLARSTRFDHRVAITKQSNFSCGDIVLTFHEPIRIIVSGGFRLLTTWEAYQPLLPDAALCLAEVPFTSLNSVSFKGSITIILKTIITIPLLLLLLLIIIVLIKVRDNNKACHISFYLRYAIAVAATTGSIIFFPNAQSAQAVGEVFKS